MCFQIHNIITTKRFYSIFFIYKYISYKMSKAKVKGKDKKKESSNEQQELIEQQKRQILQQIFTIKNLQDRLSRMTEENHQIVTTHDKFHQQYEQKIDKQRIIIESHENNIKQNRETIYDLEVSRMTLENKIKDLERQARQFQSVKGKQFEEYRRVTQNEVTKLEIQLKQYSVYMHERDEMNNESLNLKKTIEMEKNERIKDVADKQREKVLAIDKLRDEMLTKIKDMRSNLLSLKKQQLETTTRLAVLQNHQLTSQLEFQSKQSQKLIFENEQLIKKVSNLKKDLQIHKDIEDQLAKRSHYSRGIIKKLTMKVSEYEQKVKQYEQKLNKNDKLNQNSDSSIKQQNKKQQMMKALDKSLQNTQKKYIKLQSQLDTINNQNSLLKLKIQSHEKKTNSIVDLLFRFYDEILNGGLQIKDQSYQYDLKNIRSKPVEEWSKEQVRLITNFLLNQISSLVNRKNLGIPNINKNQLSVIDNDQTINNVKLPKIFDNSIINKLQMSMKMKQLPVHMASKLVGSNVREWGRTVHSNSVTSLIRKFKVNDK